MNKQDILTDTPITPADRQPPMAGELVTTRSDQPSPIEHRSTADSITPAASQSPSKPPWLKWKWKWLMFILPPIVMSLGGPERLGAKLMGSPSSDSAAKPLTQTVDRQTMPVKISANGIVKADRSINLSPKTAGTIKTLLVKEGDSPKERLRQRVRQGQVVALMDDSLSLIHI
jgi:HlyD family secretion protein